MSKTRLALALGVLSVCLVTCSAARADTYNVYHWDILTSTTVYPATFGATYSPGSPRFRWYVDTAHTTHVRMLHCTGSVWSHYMDIPNGDQNYRYFTAGGAALVVNYGQCEELQGYSTEDSLYNRNGYLLT